MVCAPNIVTCSGIRPTPYDTVTVTVIQRSDHQLYHATVTILNCDLLLLQILQMLRMLQMPHQNLMRRVPLQILYPENRVSDDSPEHDRALPRARRRAAVTVHGLRGRNLHARLPCTVFRDDVRGRDARLFSYRNTFYVQKMQGH